MSDNVTPIRPGKAHAPARITPAELRSLIDWMGLTRAWFANRLGVQERTVVRWCDGKAPIPEKAAVEIVKLWNHAVQLIVGMSKAATENAERGTVVLKTFRVDSEYHKAVDSEEFPASWHRALVCRTMDHLLMNTRYVVRLEFWEVEK